MLGRLYADGGVEMTELFRQAKETGVTTSLDMTMPDPAGPSGQVAWYEMMGRCLPYVDLFLPSVEEWLFMADRPRFDRLSAEVGAAGMIEALSPDEIRALAEKALALGCKIVVLKLGERGVYMRTAADLVNLGRGQPAVPEVWCARELWVPCFVPHTLVGTTGAGDATIAGFLAALLRGASPERALTVAAAVGACNVEAADALSGVLSWQETVDRLDGGWAQRAISLPDWTIDEQGVWHGANDIRQNAQNVL